MPHCDDSEGDITISHCRVRPSPRLFRARRRGLVYDTGGGAMRPWVRSVGGEADGDQYRPDHRLCLAVTGDRAEDPRRRRGRSARCAETGDEAELIRLAPQADAILTCWQRVTPTVIDAAERCRTIGRYGVGLDNIAVDHATARGILVTNVPDFCQEEVTDHALALILSCARKIVPFARATNAGVWDLAAARPIARLRGQTIGLIGYGAIAQTLAAKARAIGFDHRLHPAPHARPADPSGTATNDLDVLLGRPIGFDPLPADAADARPDRRPRPAPDEADRLARQYVARPDRLGRGAPPGADGRLDRRRGARRPGAGAARAATIRCWRCPMSWPRRTPPSIPRRRSRPSRRRLRPRRRRCCAANCRRTSSIPPCWSARTPAWGDDERGPRHRADRTAARVPARDGPDRARRDAALPGLAGGVSNKTVLVERCLGRRGVGAEAGAAEAARRGRLVQRPGPDPPRGARAALARRARAAGRRSRRWCSRTRRITCWRWRRCRSRTRTGRRCCWRGGSSPDHVEQFGDAARHDPPPRVERRTELAPAFDDRSFFESLRLEPYYRYTADAGAGGRGVPLTSSSPTPRDAPDARARRLQPEERPRPRRPARPARPRGHPLGRPGVRPRLRADPPAQQGASPARRTATLSPPRRAISGTTYVGRARRRRPGAHDLEARAVRHTLGCLLARVAGRRRWNTSTTPSANASARRWSLLQRPSARLTGDRRARSNGLATNSSTSMEQYADDRNADRPARSSTAAAGRRSRRPACWPSGASGTAVGAVRRVDRQAEALELRDGDPRATAGSGAARRSRT